jgi:predicted phosphodiesterase
MTLLAIMSETSISPQHGAKKEYSNITHHGILGSFTCNDYKIGMVHYPEHARGLASQSIYDIVCIGHSHVAETVHFLKNSAA